jgi:hypothetical protein
MNDLNSGLAGKQLFRFTGPPEHWLTAFKYWTWGLEADLQERWSKIQTGDVFFIHSTGSGSSFFKNAASGIIGIGVVGFHFSIKDNLLWHYELKNHINRWPLLIPLSEVYLFSELPNPETWDSPTPDNDGQTSVLIDRLLKNRIPISDIKGFPQMGSFSSVRDEVAKQILSKDRPLYLLSGHSTRGAKFREEKSDFIEVHKADDTLRHAASLRFIEGINKRVITKPYSLVSRDNDILARAESVHHSIIQNLIEIYRDKGYDTLSNPFVDLFVHNKENSILFEVKSTENRNFRSQARKGIVQLYEYDYFEINRLKRDKGYQFANEYKLLVPSKTPRDAGYVDFINSLDLGVATVADRKLIPVGKDFGFSKL